MATVDRFCHNNKTFGVRDVNFFLFRFIKLQLNDNPSSIQLDPIKVEHFFYSENKKASKSFDLKALKFAAPGIVTSNQIMQDWIDLEAFSPK
ncbi:hypothetical protein SAMN05428988_0805 [Chitinophaga sp. YR573]|nr:hypothetical protein SAMN05428988_0805 [Chitinophaga sp. YR573]